MSRLTQQVLLIFLNFLLDIFLIPYLGNVYIADCSNHHVRKVTISTGTITSLAGSSTSGSYSGDNGQATAAGLNNPDGMGVDVSGRNLLLFLYFLL